MTEDGTLFHPSNFFERFSTSLATFPFTAFRIYSNKRFLWVTSDLSEFFVSQQENIKELEFDSFLLTGESPTTRARHPMFNRFDISAWISNSPITKFSYSGGETSAFGSVFLQSCNLTTIKELSLSGCHIKLQDRVQLQPNSLILSQVKFFKDEKILPEMCIDEIFDLSKAKILCLTHICDSSATKFVLDLKGTLNIEYLRLCGVTLTNWRTCAWNVNKLTCFQPFLEKTEMQIQEIYFYYRYGPAEIDLSVLPLSIKKLKIDNVNVVVRSFQTVSLDNLQYLALKSLSNDCTWILLTIKCPNLSYLHLEGYSICQLEIRSDWIPKTVKRLKLYSVTINWIEGSMDFNLDKLVLINYQFCDVKTICSTLCQTKELVLRCPKDYGVTYALVEYLLIRNSWDYWQRIYVGPFEWPHICFENSALFKHVDRKAKYYVFENETGKGLDFCFAQFALFEKLHSHFHVPISNDSI